MALPLYLFILVALLGVTIVVVVAVAVSLSRSDRTPAGAEERAVRGVRLAGLALGTAAAAWVLLEPTPFDRGLGSVAVIAPLCLGAITLLGVVVGELVVRPRFNDGPRTATLRPRRVRDHLPPKLTRLVVAVTVAGVLLCAYTALTASADDMGRDGRSLAARCSATVSAASGPYPGSFYVLPYLAGLAVVAAIAVVAALRITRRTLGSDAPSADRYRSTGLTAVVSAYGLTMSVPLAGIALVAGTALLGHECPQTGWRIVGVSALVVALCAAGTALISLVGLLAPATLSSADEPARETATRA
ncbi:MAG: hypothetical protein ACI379_04465 [Nocardioides sp.]|uniref:hypothetical protein n=1 Tax=Nocardioides sp. TaxID=35761 RepID=UPI003F1111AF